MARVLIKAVAMAGFFALAACGSSSNNQVPSNTKALDLSGKAIRCISASDANLSSSMYSLPAEYQARLLTPEAKAAGIQVKSSGSEVSGYGSVVLYYTNQDASCVVWSESLSLQEYSQRVGLNPLGISPFYEADKKPVAPTTPVTAATETPPVTSETPTN